MLQQPFDGCELDKDLLFPGNKVYSPATCVFVPAAINTLFLEQKGSRGKYPLGVCSFRGKFISGICRGGKKCNLGVFNTPLLAHAAWQAAKAAIIDKAAAKVSDPRLKAALTLRADRLRDDLANKRETVSLNSVTS